MVKKDRDDKGIPLIISRKTRENILAFCSHRSPKTSPCINQGVVTPTRT